MTSSLPLPHHASQTTIDPLGYYDNDDFPAPLLPVIKKILESHNNNLLEVISTISYTMGFAADPDLSNLKIALTQLQTGQTQTEIIHVLSQCIEELKILWSFPQIDYLSMKESRTYSERELKCLLALQFLGILTAPPWNDWGGVNLGPHWYGGEVNMSVKIGYIRAALECLCSKTSEGRTFTFELNEMKEVPEDAFSGRMLNLIMLELDIEDDFPEFLQPGKTSDVSSRIIVVPSHRLIGHGPSATQEERILASYPELLSVSIFVPPLTDTSALYVRCRPPVLPTAHFRGHGRNALLHSINKTATNDTLQENGFLFMDASELDKLSNINDNAIRDLQPGIMERDLLKAFVGFQKSLKNCGPGKYQIVATPWGAGAFGGDIRIKMLILWIAVSAAAHVTMKTNIEFIFMVKKGVLEDKEVDATSTIEMLKTDHTIQNMWAVLAGLRKQQDITTQTPVLHLILKHLERNAC